MCSVTERQSNMFRSQESRPGPGPGYNNDNVIVIGSVRCGRRGAERTNCDVRNERAVCKFAVMLSSGATSFTGFELRWCSRLRSSVAYGECDGL